MARYDYQCQDKACGFVHEVVQSMHERRPEWKKCPACGGRAVQVILQAPAVSRQGSDNAPFDVAVGRDAALRWEGIRERQAKRDRLRKETGTEALTMTGFNDFKPLPGSQLTLVKGVKAKADTPADARLMKE